MSLCTGYILFSIKTGLPMLPSILLIFSVDNVMAVTMKPWIEMDAADVNKVEIKQKWTFSAIQLRYPQVPVQEQKA